MTLPASLPLELLPCLEARILLCSLVRLRGVCTWERCSHFQLWVDSRLAFCFYSSVSLLPLADVFQTTGESNPSYCYSASCSRQLCPTAVSHRPEVVASLLLELYSSRLSSGSIDLSWIYTSCCYYYPRSQWNSRVCLDSGCALRWGDWMLLAGWSSSMLTLSNAMHKTLRLLGVARDQAKPSRNDRR